MPRTSARSFAALVAAAACGAALPSAAGARPGPAPEPVVVLAGLSGTCTSAADNATLAGRVAQGLSRAYARSGGTVQPVPSTEVRGWRYGVCNTTLRTVAKQLDTYLAGLQAARGGVPIDLVSFSFGGSVVRYCLTNAGGDTPGCVGRVDDWVGVVNSTYGTTAATYDGCARTTPVDAVAICRSVIPGSPEQLAMNRADPSPGAVEYTSVWSPGDEIVRPAGSGRLPGALNVELRSRLGTITHAGSWIGGACTTTQDWVAVPLLDVFAHSTGELVLDCNSPI